MRYVYETIVVVCTSLAVLHGIFIMVADAGRPPVGYSLEDRQRLNWLVQHSTKQINGKYQGRVSE